MLKYITILICDKIVCFLIFSSKLILYKDDESSSQKDFNDKFFINTNKYNLRQSQIPLIVDIKDTGSDTALTGGTTFRAKLNEPIIIDKLSEVYLDNFMTINSLFGNTPANAAFAIKINEFSSKTAGASTDQTTRCTIQSKLLIPNENINTDNFDSLVVHKGKKMNYVCEINPTKIHENIWNNYQYRR